MICIYCQIESNYVSKLGTSISVCEKLDFPRAIPKFWNKVTRRLSIN